MQNSKLTWYQQIWIALPFALVAVGGAIGGACGGAAWGLNKKVFESTSNPVLRYVFTGFISGGAFLAYTLVAAFVVTYFHLAPASSNRSSSATPAAVTPARPATPQRFANVAEAQREAVRRYPDLGIAGSKLNSAFAARCKTYQQQRPDYFRDPSWPIRLAEELAQPQRGNSK
jgi:hypothetical protein